ncbi:hypothetical protein FP2506_18539 [Fulvimarina pelagi HTCC2506]|uniref:Uncharacterized protein n=1 Tax=Fulvimarina pelagi HTCC2506 TaxID=314231 RepID=Q0G0S5_9HYPH|nr:hypothetical protein FP2506_18539 [Fulvimarina pelagi HTCC2506]
MDAELLAPFQESVSQRLHAALRKTFDSSQFRARRDETAVFGMF